MLTCSFVCCCLQVAGFTQQLAALLCTLTGLGCSLVDAWQLQRRWAVKWLAELHAGHEQLLQVQLWVLCWLQVAETCMQLLQHMDVWTAGVADGAARRQGGHLAAQRCSILPVLSSMLLSSCSR
jgi:hypothetical protein